MKWGLEPMYVARNDEGVIIRVQEDQPAEFLQEQPMIEKEDELEQK